MEILTSGSIRGANVSRIRSEREECCRRRARADAANYCVTVPDSDGDNQEATFTSIGSLMFADRPRDVEHALPHAGERIADVLRRPTRVESLAAGDPKARRRRVTGRREDALHIRKNLRRVELRACRRPACTSRAPACAPSTLCSSRASAGGMFCMRSMSRKTHDPCAKSFRLGRIGRALRVQLSFFGGDEIGLTVVLLARASRSADVRSRGVLPHVCCPT